MLSLHVKPAPDFCANAASIAALIALAQLCSAGSLVPSRTQPSPQRRDLQRLGSWFAATQARQFSTCRRFEQKVCRPQPPAETQHDNCSFV